MKEKPMEKVLKYWPVITAVGMGVFLGLAWGLRLELKTNDNAALVKEHDAAIDRLEHKVIRLDTLEEGREKGICK